MTSKDQYDVLEVLGTGTFGTVSRIRLKGGGNNNHSCNKDLVWKEINFGRMCDKEKAQIVSEVNILRELRCPFIVKYHDRIIDKLTKKLYIVMEYCSGGDLSQVIKKCKKDRVNLDESVIWKVFAQSIIALKCCHRRKENNECKPVIHRDLKPANILLDQNQNIKIADFGLAKELNSISILANTNVGTPFYMAPEIINEKGYDERCDIWSLGCLIYELAALRPPFEATNVVSLAMKINTGKFPRIPNKYSDTLFDIIKLMLQHDPKSRPRIEDLENLPCLNFAINNAKALMTEYNNNVNNSKLKMKEDALKVKEEELKIKEDSLKLKEESLHSLEVLLCDRERELNKKEAAIKDQMLMIKKAKDEIDSQKKEADMKLSNDVGKAYEFQSKAIGFNIHIDNNNTIFQPKQSTTTFSNSSNNTIRNVEIDGALRRAKEVLSSCHAKDISIKRPSIEIDIPLNKKAKTGAGAEDKENIQPAAVIPRVGPIQISTEYFKENQFNKIRSARLPISDINTKRMKFEN